MQLTTEQFNAVNAFQTGSPLRLIAYAGAGKTSTLRAMAGAVRRSGLYLAFNKAIATESAHKFQGTGVDCRTAHSIAHRWAAGRGYTSDKLTGRLDLRAVASLPVSSEFSGRERMGRRLALATVRKWMQSDAPFVSLEFVPPHVGAAEVKGAEAAYNEALKTGDMALIDGALKTLSDVRNAVFSIRMGAVHTAVNMWNQMVNPSSQVPLGHDGYLKLWALSHPQLLTDVVYVDEAQDLNPVLIGVLANQQRQIVSVGDPHQQIYAWRGAVDALRILPGQDMRLSQSFRFGGKIATTAARLLEAMGETVPLRGNGRPGFVGPEDGGEADAILCRTNAGVFSAAAERPGCSIAGGTAELRALVADIERLQAGREATGLELSSFGTWQEVCDAVDEDEGSSLAPIVRIVEREGVGYLRHALARAVDGGWPCIGTAHKTKGLEFDHVAIADDFRAEKPSLEERRLFYVALTRAKFEVNVSDDVLGEYLTTWEIESDEA